MWTVLSSANSLSFALSGRKCTYGMKCRFHHPERAKQSQQSVPIDLWQNSDQNQALTRCSPGPELSLSLEEDIPKLTLGHKSVSLQQQERLGQGRQRSGRRPQTRKKKTCHQPDTGEARDSARDNGSARDSSLVRDSSSVRDSGRDSGSVGDSSSVRDSGRDSRRDSGRDSGRDRDSVGDSSLVRDRTSQEQLDSGLGSMDSQLMETVDSLCYQHYRPSYGSVQQQFCPPSGPPCSCCCPGPSRPPSGHPSPPISWPPFSQPADLQCSRRLRPQQRFWSDPFCICPPETRRQLDERSLWDPPPRPCRTDREDVRKKLLAIFSAQLVDAAMDMSPGQLDPQRLVAQILMLQSQTRSLRS